MNRKLGRRVLQFMLKSNLRKKEYPSVWVEEIFQNLRKDVDASVIRFDRTIEEERTIDLYDSDDETIVVKQEPVTEEPFIKLDEF